MFLRAIGVVGSVPMSLFEGFLAGSFIRGGDTLSSSGSLGGGGGGGPARGRGCPGGSGLREKLLFYGIVRWRSCGGARKVVGSRECEWVALVCR